MSNLLTIQKALKAPKNQFNNFGKYKYRNCEDILEALKPILEDCTLTISDEIVNIGNRFYVKATVRFTDSNGNGHEVSAYAREEESKKGMDGSQVTGASSSYARKYALNGLFLIDDTKDADSDEKPKEKISVVKKEDIPETLGNEPAFVNEAHVLTMKQIIDEKKVDMQKFCDFMGVDKIEHIVVDEFEKALKVLKTAKGTKVQRHDSFKIRTGRETRR